MNELTVQFPLHRHALSDFTFDDQRHSQSSKGLGMHVLCYQCTVTVCLLTVCCILKWESRATKCTSTQHRSIVHTGVQCSDLTYCSHWHTCCLTHTIVVTHREFLRHELLSWGDVVPCGCTSSRLYATTSQNSADMPKLGSAPQRQRHQLQTLKGPIHRHRPTMLSK